MSPPPIVFKIVWPILYLIMATSCLLYSLHGGNVVGYLLFATQLFLNGLWLYLFFSLHLYWASFIDLLCLVVVVAATTWVFWATYWPAGLLLIPYLVWLLFALSLMVVGNQK